MTINNQPENNTDMKIYNQYGEHVGFIDIFSDSDKLSLLDPDDTKKLTVYLTQSKQVN